MGVVVVHGVNVRMNRPGFEANQRLISGLIERHFHDTTFGGLLLSNPKPTFPYWGKYGSEFAWDMASLPNEFAALGEQYGGELYASVAKIAEILPDASDAPEALLLAVARKNLSDAIDILTKASLALAKNGKEGVEAEENKRLAEFLIRAQVDALDDPKPAWLNEVANDRQLIDELLERGSRGVDGGLVGLGVIDNVRNCLVRAADAIKNAARGAGHLALDRGGDFVSTKLVALGRRPLNGVLGRFLGDIFTYLSTRGEIGITGEILDTIAADVEAAQRPGEPLVIFGHSLGGVITFDLLSHYRPDIKVDLFVTVGSQVAHFAEIRRLKISRETDGTPTKLTVPNNIVRWINVFDPVDIFGYAAQGVFDGVEDFGYDTRTHTIDAHSSYLIQEGFYRRLKDRL